VVTTKYDQILPILLIAKALWVCLLLRFFPEEKEMDAAQLQRQREYLSPQLRLFLA
jgi:hypothetical protein